MSCLRRLPSVAIDHGFGEDILKRALRAGADQAEIYIRSARGLTVEVKDRQVDALKSSRSFGYGLRVLRKGCPGFSYSNLLDDADTVVRNAVAAAAYADSDVYLELPDPSNPSALVLQDPEVEATKEEEAIRLAVLMEDAARSADSRVSKIRKASGSFASAELLIMNSKKVHAGYCSTACSAQITVIAEDKGDAQAGFEYSGSRFLRGISFEETGVNAARHACSLLGARKFSARRAPVILESSVAADFLGILSDALSADYAQKGKSLLNGRQGNSILSPRISIVDDGQLPGMLGSCPVDDEGVPSRKKVLFDCGVLQGFLHNTYTGRKWAVPSTGNASRGGYASLPAVGISNLYLEAASGETLIPRQALAASVGTGLHVLDAMGIHTANPVSGDYSVGVTGLWIENGVPVYPVKEAVISGNILELFSSIDAVADDLKFYGGIGCASLVIREMNISA
ncbi:MAG: TldD/PmbA family protein [Thermodesulfovibrio sp.]|nr:TldD/PmbA family protein [Thermodesulfovibrio sp.]